MQKYATYNDAHYKKQYLIFHFTDKNFYYIENT